MQLSAVGIAQFSTSQIGAELYGGNGTQPSGSPLVSFVIPAGTISGGATDVTMTPASPFTLQSSTSYWLVLHAVGGNLGVNTAANPAAGAFATYAGMTQDGGLPPTSHNGSNVIFAVSDVPEPGTCCVVAVTAGLLSLRRLRRR